MSFVQVLSVVVWILILTLGTRSRTLRREMQLKGKFQAPKRFLICFLLLTLFAAAGNFLFIGAQWLYTAFIHPILTFK